MIVEIRDPIFNADIVAFITESQENIKKWLKKEQMLEQEEYVSLSSNEGVAGDVGDWFFMNLSNTEAGLIAHESFHITHRVLKSRGIPLEEASDEVYAYYLNFIITRVTEELQKVKV